MTNKTTEALKLAEEALGCSQLYIDEYHPEWIQVRQENEGALSAIRKALSDHSGDANEMVADPVQEPVVDYAYATIKEYEELAGFSVSEAFKAGWNMARTTNSMLGINAAPVQPVKQEPVAWQFFEDGRWHNGSDYNYHRQNTEEAGYQIRELYAAPVDAKAIRVEECERICAAIKAEDDYCIDNGDYMLDSNDCIKVARGEWVRPEFDPPLNGKSAAAIRGLK